MIKYKINPKSLIVVGGVHPSILPQGFNSKNYPQYLKNYYQKSGTPFDYIIMDEGEKPFFHFIESICIDTIQKRENPEEDPIILKREFLESLDEIPPLNLDLFKKYENVINGVGNFYIRFNRGCAFRCKFCLPSEDYTESSKIVKYRSLQNCIADLDTIINSEWLKIRQLHVIDPMFFPKRSIRNKFFEKLDEIADQINFSINIFDRIETCTTQDLDNYKKYNMIIGLGLESVSTKLLIRMGKVIGKNEMQLERSALNYVEKTKELIKYSNAIETTIVFFYMLGVPGTDEDTLKERWRFFFEKTNGKAPLMERYKIDLEFFMFAIFTGNTLYDKGEKMFGARYYYPEWWRIFDKDQAAYAVTIDPSKTLSYRDQAGPTIDFIKKVFKLQMRLKNPFYLLPRFLEYKKNFERTLEIYDLTRSESTRKKRGETNY